MSIRGAEAAGIGLEGVKDAAGVLRIGEVRNAAPSPIVVVFPRSRG